MSKIFEALQNGDGEVADPILTMLDGEKAPRERVTERCNTTAEAKPDHCVVPSNGSSSGAETEAVAAFSPRRTLSLHVAASSPILPFHKTNSQASEQYRILRTKLTQHSEKPRSILISSPATGDGKSITAVNLAGALSLKNEASVLLVDADFRRSTIPGHLGLPATPGLADVLAGTCSLQQAIVRTQEFPTLHVIAAGRPAGNPAELLYGAQWPALCSRLRDLFRYVVVDSPPVAAVADYDLLQTACDGVVLVIRSDRTNRGAYQRALKTVPARKLLGVVLNCVPKWCLGRYTAADYYQD